MPHLTAPRDEQMGGFWHPLTRRPTWRNHSLIPAFADRRPDRQISALFLEVCPMLSCLWQNRTSEERWRTKPRLGSSPACSIRAVPRLSIWWPRCPARRIASAPGLHPRSAESLAELVRVMNCYYSNLIEATTRRRVRSSGRWRISSMQRRGTPQPSDRGAGAYPAATGNRPAPRGRRPAGTCVGPFIRWLHRSSMSDAPEAMLLIKGGTGEVAHDARRISHRSRT